MTKGRGAEKAQGKQGYSQKKVRSLSLSQIMCKSHTRYGLSHTPTPLGLPFFPDSASELFWKGTMIIVMVCLASALLAAAACPNGTLTADIHAIGCAEIERRSRQRVSTAAGTVRVARQCRRRSTVTGTDVVVRVISRF